MYTDAHTKKCQRNQSNHVGFSPCFLRRQKPVKILWTSFHLVGASHSSSFLNTWHQFHAGRPASPPRLLSVQWTIKRLILPKCTAATGLAIKEAVQIVWHWLASISCWCRHGKCIFFFRKTKDIKGFKGTCGWNAREDYVMTMRWNLLEIAGMHSDTRAGLDRGGSWEIVVFNES